MWIKAPKNKHNKGYYISGAALAGIYKSDIVCFVFGGFSAKPGIVEAQGLIKLICWYQLE